MGGARTCQQPARLIRRQVRDLHEAPQRGLRVEGRVDLAELRDERVHHRALVRRPEPAANWRRVLLPHERPGERQAAGPAAGRAAAEAARHGRRGASAAFHPARGLLWRSACACRPVCRRWTRARCTRGGRPALLPAIGAITVLVRHVVNRLSPAEKLRAAHRGAVAHDANPVTGGHCTDAAAYVP